jgi:photosystem II stability/assembly factor-like uncharacterized protein
MSMILKVKGIASMQKPSLIVLICIVQLALCEQALSQWVQTNGPTGGHVSSVATSNAYCVVGTLGGGVFLSTNSGERWNPVYIDWTSGDVTDVAILGETVFAAAGGSVYLTTDRGSTWIQSDSGITGSVYVLHLTPGVMLAGDWFCNYYRSTDMGRHWASVHSELVSTTRILAIESRGSTCYAGTSVGFRRSTDHGATWEVCSDGLSNPYVFAIGVSESTLLAGTDRGIYKSIDDGVNWVPTTNSLSNSPAYAIEISVSNALAGTSKGIYRSSDNGETWLYIGYDIGTVMDFGRLSSTGFAATALGLYRSSDGGITWMDSNAGLVNSEAFCLLSFGPRLFAGSASGLFATDEEGASWTIFGTGESMKAISALCATDTRIFAGTFGHGGLFSTNGGASWSDFGTGLESVSILGLSVVANGSGSSMRVLAGTNRGIFLSEDNGLSWNAGDTLLSHSTIAAIASVGSEVIAATGNNEVFVSTDYGTTWERAATCPTSRILTFAVSGTKVLAGTYQGLWYSTDMGRSWFESTSGLQGVPIEALEVCPIGILAGTHGEGVYLSTNNGSTWNYRGRGLAATYVRDIVVHGDCAYLGTRGGGVWKRQLSEMVVSATKETTALPEMWELLQNFPNPFNPTTAIRFSLPRRSYVRLAVYNTLGQEVTHLINGEVDAGPHEIKFDASNLPSGVYFYRLQAGSFTGTKRLLLVR